MNTVGQDVDLSQGAVSRSLLNVAGQGMQQECRTQVPAGQQLNIGQIIRTSGHQLRCKDVLHGVLNRWDGPGGTCKQVSIYVVEPEAVSLRYHKANTNWKK